MLLEELLRCQIQEWYPLFRRHTIPTRLLPLPAPFLRYLAGRRAYPDPDADADADDDSPLPFLLPAITTGRDSFPAAHTRMPDPVSLLDTDNNAFFGSDDDDDDDDGSANLLRPAFPELEAAVEAAIAELSGAAFPKLNWSAPKDAAFMAADGSLQCRCFAEVAMLLRASDRVAHDLTFARQACADYALPDGRAGCVRRNGEESSGGEEGARQNAQESFRGEGVRLNCQESGEEERGGDVRRNAQVSGGEEGNGSTRPNARENSDNGDAPKEVVVGQEEGGQGGSQEGKADDGFQYYLALRKWYSGLRPESEFRCFVRARRLVGISQRDPSAYYPSLPGWCVEVQPKIEAFFAEVIEPRFGLENYTFDAYVRADGLVKLIDFNPWGGYTLPLLFTWEELEEEGRREHAEFRVVMQHGAVRPGLMTAVPYDMLDWGEGSGWDVFMKKAEGEFRRQMDTLGGDS